MTLVCPDQGEFYLLRILFGTDSQNYTIRLFTSDTTPGESTVIGDVTQLSTGLYTPYSPIAADWSFSTSGGITTASLPLHTFSIGGAADIYGWYMSTGDNDRLFCIERFSSAPFVYTSDGGNLDLTVKITLD